MPSVVGSSVSSDIVGRDWRKKNNPDPMPTTEAVKTIWEMGWPVVPAAPIFTADEKVEVSPVPTAVRSAGSGFSLPLLLATAS